MPLLMAVVIGLPLGLILKKFNAHYGYNDVISLGVATWTAAILSWWTAKIGIPKKGKLDDEKSHKVFHAYGGLGIDQKWSQSELESFYDGIVTGPDAKRYTIQSTEHPGTEIKALLLSCNEETLSSLALEAFPGVPDLARRTALVWDRGMITVELASMRSVIPKEADIRAISFYAGGRLHIIVDPESDVPAMEQPKIGSNCRVVAETLIHAVGEAFFGLSHEHALVSESLLVCRYVNEEITRVPERLRRALPATLTAQKKHVFLTATRKELLRYLCYGLPFETTWDTLPLEIRHLLLRRCLGEATSLTDTQLLWLETNLQAENGCSVETRVARFDLGAILSVHKLNYFRKQAAKQLSEKSIITDVSEDFQWLKNQNNISVKMSVLERMMTSIRIPMSRFYHTVGTWIKFLVIAPIADPEYQRELNCVINRSHALVRPARYLPVGLWIYARTVQSIILPWFLFKGRQNLSSMWKSIKGTLITLKHDRLTIQSFENNVTAFIRKGAQGSFKLFYYSGIHDKEPQDGEVIAVSSYSKHLRLTAREEFINGVSTNEYIYEYPSGKKKTSKSRLSKSESSRIPLSRVCVRGQNQTAVVQYNHKGFIESGSYVRHGNLVRFKYHYRKNAKYDDELLRAEFVLPHLSCNVSWAAPPIRHPEKPERWIPHSRVQEATFVQGSDVYECTW
jgi:hypothetical protein